jgi:hypothetical protein
MARHTVLALDLTHSPHHLRMIRFIFKSCTPWTKLQTMQTYRFYHVKDPQWTAPAPSLVMVPYTVSAAFEPFASTCGGLIISVQDGFTQNI